MKRRNIGCFLVLFLTVFLVVGGILYLRSGYFKDRLYYSFIKEIDDFPADSRTELYTDYGITIPENAHFVKGYNLNHFRDPATVVAFQIDLNLLTGQNYTNAADAVYEILELKKAEKGGVWHGPNEIPLYETDDQRLDKNVHSSFYEGQYEYSQYSATILYKMISEDKLQICIRWR